MAAHQMWKTTDLMPLLAERGVTLSSSQAYRLVTERPERLSIKTLAALCDIFDCTPNDLIEPYLEAAARKKATGTDTKVTPINQNLRPERARIVDPD
jgi:DNA-binding Xre family transcriptional regulator